MVIEVHNSKSLNVAQNEPTEPMKVEVEYVQGYSYIVIFGIYRICQAAFPIFDILIYFGVMTERLNPYDGFFRVLGFFDPPAPHRQIFKILSR